MGLKVLTLSQIKINRARKLVEKVGELARNEIKDIWDFLFVCFLTKMSVCALVVFMF